MNDSSAIIEDSNILNRIDIRNKSNATIINSNIYTEGTNACYTSESKLSIDDCLIEGGTVGERYSYCVAAVAESEVILNDSNVVQHGFAQPGSMYYAFNSDKSKCEINKSVIDSLRLIQSTGSLSDSHVKDIIELWKESYLEIEDIVIYGRKSRYVNLFLSGKSQIKGDIIYFCLKSNVDIKLGYDCLLDVESVGGLVYDEAQDALSVTEDNMYVEKDFDYSIEYFGEKPALMQLEELVGYHNVEEELLELIAIASMNKSRSLEDKDYKPLSLQTSFVGDNGTGKKTVAEKFVKVLHKEGLIKNSNLTVLTQIDIIGETLDDRLKKLREIFNSAQDGVLLINKADIILKDSNIMNETLSYIQEHGKNIIVILTGDEGILIKDKYGKVERFKKRY